MAPDAATDTTEITDWAAKRRRILNKACGTVARAPRTMPRETTRVIGARSGSPKNAAIAGAAANMAA